MPVTYGRNLTRLGRASSLRTTTVLEKASVPHSAKSDVFLSYQRRDESIAVSLAAALDTANFNVYIDIHDETLSPGDRNLESALVTAIENSDTMVITVSDNTQMSWWVPWEIGVSTPSSKPKAMYKPRTLNPLPDYLAKLIRLENAGEVSRWINASRGS